MLRDNREGLGETSEVEGTRITPEKESLENRCSIKQQPGRVSPWGGETEQAVVAGGRETDSLGFSGPEPLKREGMFPLYCHLVR